VDGVQRIIARIGIRIRCPARAGGRCQRVDGEETTRHWVIRPGAQPFQSGDFNTTVGGEPDASGQFGSSLGCSQYLPWVVDVGGTCGAPGCRLPLLPDAGEAAGAGEDRGLTNTDGCWGGCGQVPLDGGAVDFGQLTERIDRQVGGFVVVGDLGQPTARVPRVVHRVLRGGGPDASALPVIGVLRGGTIGFGHGDELTGGVVVQGAGAVGGEFVDESSAGVIGPGSAAGGAVGLDQLAGVVVGIDGVPIGAIDLVNATVKIPADAGDSDAGWVGQGVDHRIAVVIFPGLQLVAGAGF